MSWDVYLMKVPKSIISVEEMNDQFKPQPLGKHDDIITIFKELFPVADFSDPNWGTLNSEDYSIEFNISKSDPVESIALHIRGNEKCVEVVRKICNRTGWSAIDTGTGDFMDFSNSPEKGFVEWSKFRDQVFENINQNPTNEKEIKKSKVKKKWWKFLG